MDEVLEAIGGTEVAIAFAIISGVVGFLANALHERHVARRNAQLERVNRQLSELYGPLFALHRSNQLAWDAFRRDVRPGKAFFGSDPPPTEEELTAWRHWMKEVFQPANAEMLNAVVHHADLLIELEFPPSLQEFCAHVSSYQAVLARWESGDFADHVAACNYPTEELGRYLETSYRALKRRQADLLGTRC